MSKADAQRAMREAKYARNRASGPTRRESSGTATPPAPAAAPVKAPRASADSSTQTTDVAASAATPAQTTSCGHKSMNGRTCTRPAGHTEKSHRYT
jgi:hypothetical protein